ncbi:hypothetical protein [Fredinandcohnia quinoae]|uniref:Uncharacterized protein n=1 Tax=Fredinandcohnia quinoae TaxID=2918902 RepID=A0AAW5EC09_9BACI|nr:hypothetical protein [Fredinandcohnia sp. SECRCQ15]MCH1627205.1 hypothetical protein [Fredinandcohnia sp. SECRCQ15]
MENVQIDEVQHTYLVFKKLERDDFLYEEWADCHDYESLNYKLRDLYINHNHRGIKTHLKDNLINLITIEFNSYNFVFTEKKNLYSNSYQIILVNYFPIGFSFPPNKRVVTEFFDQNDKDKFIINGSYTEYIPKELEEVIINGEYFLIEEEKKYNEIARYYSAINTHKPFCDFCEVYFDGKKTLSEGKEMKQDFINFRDNNPSKGEYEYLDLGSLFVITKFFPKEKNFT